MQPKAREATAGATLRYSPLICVTLLLGAAGALWLGAAPQSWGLGHDTTLVRALVYLELALAPLVLCPKPGRESAIVLGNLLHFAATWLAASACVLLFSFAGADSPAWQTRLVSLCAWLAAGGLLALGAALSPAGPARVRPLLLALFGLPLLFHYIGLEYAGASQSHLAALCPHWLVWRGDYGPAWVLMALGLAGWLGAGGLCLWKRRPA